MLLPSEMARKAEETGVKKAAMAAVPTFVLAILAGSFIALGAVFSTTVTSGTLSFGMARMLGGITFSLGLILVVVGGAELFTGNNLIVMAWAGRRVATRALLRHWAIVYLGNFAGAVATAALIAHSGQLGFGEGAVGARLVAIAVGKMRLTFLHAVALGILCNVLVCLAVWLCYGAASVADKILAVLFPITAFVACGFEHCVANMYYLPAAIFHGARVTWGDFLLKSLLPVTIGNILGGSVLVALVYWFVYLRGEASRR